MTAKPTLRKLQSMDDVDLSGAADGDPLVFDSASGGAKHGTGGFIPSTALDTDGTLAADSDTRVASQKAVKTYADALRGLPVTIGSRLFGLGDSITLFDIGASGSLPFAVIQPRSYLAWATMYSQGRLTFTGVSAVGGYDTNKINTLLLPAALASDATLISVVGGTNDAINGTAIATTIANLTSIYTQILAAGKTPICCTIPPSSVPTTGQLLLISKINAWIKRYAQLNNLPLVDFHAVLVDPTNGHYQTAYTSDGTHPAAPAAKLMGQTFYNAVAPFLPVATGILADWNGDTAFLDGATPNLLMLNDTNADGVPNNWALSQGTGTQTLVAATAPAVGNLMTLVASTVPVTQQDIPGTAIAGHKYRLAFRCASTVKDVGGSIIWQLTNVGTTQIFLSIDLWTEDVPANSVWSCEFVAPAGLASYAMLMQQKVFSGVGGQAQLGQFSLIDLTAAGIA